MPSVPRYHPLLGSHTPALSGGQPVQVLHNLSVSRFRFLWDLQTVDF